MDYIRFQRRACLRLFSLSWCAVCDLSGLGMMDEPDGTNPRGAGGAVMAGLPSERPSDLTISTVEVIEPEREPGIALFVLPDLRGIVRTGPTS